jgi:hypothetical protein
MRRSGQSHAIAVVSVAVAKKSAHAFLLSLALPRTTPQLLFDCSQIGAYQLSVH